MEYKKKTIIWEDNNEPPKDYIWAKKDGKFYEYNYTVRDWVESSLISSGKSEDDSSSDDSSEDDTSTQTWLSVCFPYRTKIVGFIPNDDHDAFDFVYDTRTATLNNPFIPIEEIEQYVLNIETSWSGEYHFAVVIEYDELAFTEAQNGHDIAIPEFSFYLGGVESNSRYIEINPPRRNFERGTAMKCTIDGKDYMVFAVLSD